MGNKMNRKGFHKYIRNNRFLSPGFFFGYPTVLVSLILCICIANGLGHYWSSVLLSVGLVGCSIFPLIYYKLKIDKEEELNYIKDYIKYIEEQDEKNNILKEKNNILNEAFEK